MTMKRPEIDARNQAMAERYRHGGVTYRQLGIENGISMTRARQVIQRVEWERAIALEDDPQLDLFVFEFIGYGARVVPSQRRE
jgi:hypothetical protein